MLGSPSLHMVTDFFTWLLKSPVAFHSRNFSSRLLYRTHEEKIVNCAPGTFKQLNTLSTSHRYQNMLLFHSCNTNRKLLKYSYFFRNLINSYLLPCRGMAGHSKWQNIRHIKASNDSKKALMFQKYGHMLRRAAADNGPNPKLNSKLADLIEIAKSHNMPAASIENAIKKASSGKLRMSEYEILGPGGCLLIVNTETDNTSRTRGDMKHFCRKFHCSIVESKKTFMYEQKGIINVNGTKDNLPLDVDKALETAIESGAEDVQKVTDEEGKEIIKFVCDPDDFFQVKKKLENSTYIIQNAEVEYVPRVTVELNEEEMELTRKLFEELESHPDVIRIYDNIQ